MASSALKEPDCMPRVDVLLLCGDLTQCGGKSAFKRALNMISAIPASIKLVIPGNHDLELDSEYWRTHLDEGDEVEKSKEAIDIFKSTSGITYLEEGFHNISLPDGRMLSLFASPYQPEFNDMAFAYPRDNDHFSILGREVDIVVTHGPAQGTLDQCSSGNVGYPSLRKALGRVKPRLHCFGHIHEGYGAVCTNGNGTIETVGSQLKDGVRYAEKTFTSEQLLSINASIVNSTHQPGNAPWIVELAF